MDEILVPIEVSNEIKNLKESQPIYLLNHPKRSNNEE
jgi:hypothetical protein